MHACLVQQITGIANAGISNDAAKEIVPPAFEIIVKIHVPACVQTESYGLILI
jgi:hypothetical protein